MIPARAEFSRYHRQHGGDIIQWLFRLPQSRWKLLSREVCRARIFTSQRSSTNRTGSSERRSFATTRQGYRQMLAWMRSFGELQRIGDRVDRQLRRRAPALHAAGKGRGPRGHDPRQAGSASTRQERRSRRPERRPCRLCRSAADAAKPGRHDRIPTDSHGLPEDGGERQARSPADDPQYHRLRP